jgi:hypothetical protein
MYFRVMGGAEVAGMSGTSRRVAPRAQARGGLGLSTAVAVLVSVATMLAGIAVNGPGTARARPAPPRAPANARANMARSLTIWGRAPLAQGTGGTEPRSPAAPLVLTGADRRRCPALATACVDLTRHITWLQRDGKVTFGPVRMEPGRPGSQHQTDPGTYFISWRAGPSYVSDKYHEAMPWATFFGTDGDAFHGGSLSAWSHGCVHLTDANAHYYNEHLPAGAQVVVF